MGYTVETLAKRPEYDVIPSWFWKQIPTECPYCGLPTEMQLGLTKLTCCNPRCCAKVAKRVEALLNDLGIKGIGEAGVQKFIQITTPVPQRNPMRAARLPIRGKKMPIINSPPMPPESSPRMVLK